jgi:dTDP-L-rhamnose 4-epimerase
VDANVAGTATLMEVVLERRERVRRLVAASSMVVYGEGSYRCSEHGPAAPPIRSPEQLRRREWEPRCPRCGVELEPTATSEDAPLRPASVYGITKRDQEELVLVLGRAYGLETVALRYRGIYVPRQALGHPNPGVAAIFAARLLNGRVPLVFEDGLQLRDLVHVADVVRATLAAMDTPRAAGHAINVASGEPVRILDLARRLAAALAPSIEPRVTAEYRAGDIRHCFADLTRARDLLGVEPEGTLAAGLPELAEWVALQTTQERGDQALAELRAHGLIG